MKKYTLLALALALCGAMLVGCGCMNSDAEMTTVPTTRPPITTPSTTATTAPTTMPTTAPTTMPQTDPTAMDGSTMETAGEDGIVDTEPSTNNGGTGTTGGGQENNSKSRSRHQMPPMR